MPTPVKAEAQAQVPLRPGVLKNGPATSPGGRPPVKAARVGGDGKGQDMEIEGLGGVSVTVSPRALASGSPGLPADSSTGGLQPTNLVDRLFPATEADAPKAGNEVPEEEPTLKDLMREMRKMSVGLEQRIESVQTNFGQRFDSIGKQFADFKHDLQTLKAEMVTKDVFAGLEERVATLEAGGVAKTEISWMQRQINYLDPANKSLCFRGFTEKDGAKRAAKIEECLAEIGTKNAIRGVEHIWTGSPENRTMSAVSVVELSSRSVRETCLKKLGEDNAIMANAGVGTIKVKRAKTNLQMNRNNTLYRIQDFLKKEPSTKSKSIEIIWKMDGSKDRGVKVGDDMAFVQKSTDLSGSFLAPFQNL